MELRVAGSTDQSVYVYITEDVGGTNPGEPKTGLTHSNISSIYYTREGGTAATIGTLSTLAAANSAHADGGFKEVDATNCPGQYRVDIPDAAVATGVASVIIHVRVAAASNAVCSPLKLALVDVDVRDSVRAGLTALPNAAADAAGGLPVSDAGGLDLDGVLSGNVPQSGDSYARLGAPAGASVSADIAAVPTASEINTEVDTALSDYDGPTRAELTSDINSVIAKLLAYAQLLARSDAAIASDLSTELGEINADEGSGAGGYDNTTESLQAVRDRGDAAWTTGGGGSISDILNVQMLIPFELDLANTSTWRLGMMLFNAVDDLPSTAEITPGTISIDRKAIGGTSWSSVVSDAACSEAAGLIYYDEVFDSATGYAEGDSIRITFKSQKITVSANDYEISDATGRIFYTSIRQTMRGTDSANTTTPLDAAGIRSAVGLASADLDTQLDAIPTAAEINAEVDTALADYDAPTKAELDAGLAALNDLDATEVQTAAAAALTAYDPPTKAELDSGLAALNDPTAAAIADAVLDEALAGHVVAGSLGKAVADIEADTNELQADWANGGRLDLLLDQVISDIAALNDLSAAQVATEISDALNSDAVAEPSSVPAASAPLSQKLAWVFMHARNKIETTSSEQKLYADDGTTVVGTATVSDDGTTFTKSEAA